MAWVIQNGTVLDAEGEVRRGALGMHGDRIVQAPDDARHYDAAGCWVLPGIVDVHGDGFERILEPRPGVRLPLGDALRETDRQLLANGITTAFQAVSVSWEPGLRSLASAAEIIDEVVLTPVRCDMRVHLRWESFALDALPRIEAWLSDLDRPILSINDHTTSYLGLTAGHRKIRRMAERMGATPEETVRGIDGVTARAAEVPAAVARICAAAQAAGSPVFAHDETSPALRAANRALGAHVCEFPMNEATAAAARAAGEAVVVGAPNVIRGGSQNDAICAASAIRTGRANVLASDYAFSSLHLAALRLVREGMPLADAWAPVSRNAALAAGLKDRGTLAPGMRADVIVLDPVERRVRAVWVAGRCMLRDD